MDFYSAQGEYDEEDSGAEEQEPCPGSLRHATGIRVPRCGLVLTSRHLANNTTVTASAFIATNPEALLPHSIASTPPLGANLLTPNSLRRGAGLGGRQLGSLDCEHVFDRLLSRVERNIKEVSVPLGWKKDRHHSMEDRRSRFLESTTLF